jgi:hypothetical protein
MWWLQVAGQVLSVGAQQNVEEIQKIARLNKITNYECFSDRPEKVLHQVAAKISCDKACVVVTCIANRTSATICEYVHVLSEPLYPQFLDHFLSCVPTLSNIFSGGLFHSGCPTKVLYWFFISHMHAECSAHLILLGFYHLNV